MNIGTKINNARIRADLTQEQVAESLGVSRQTISNWENEKTYPDIISVIKMSDLYHISLDHLLKEGQTMSPYLNYLEESTNVVKSNDRKQKTILISSCLCIWAFCLLVFWLPDDVDALAYSIMFLGILLPVTIFVYSIIIGKNDYWGKRKWFSALVFGVMYMLSEYATFSAANMAYAHHFNTPDLDMIVSGGVVSLIGLVIGSAICYHKKKRIEAAVQEFQEDHGDEDQSE